MILDTEGQAKNVVKMLIDKGLTISTAESCTGGLLAAMLTEVPGASKVINECIVTYSNEAKMRELCVPEEIINKFGAVSYDTAEKMAKGICKKTGADIGVAITGIAGPDGGSDEKPVGTVFVGICVMGRVSVYELHLKGERSTIRYETCRFVLETLA